MPFIRIVKHFGECVNTQSIISHREMKQHGLLERRKAVRVWQIGVRILSLPFSSDANSVKFLHFSGSQFPDV